MIKGIRDATLGEGAWESGTRSWDRPVGSRREALKSLTSAVLAGDSAPILLTGEPGTGKSWLWRRLTQQLPAGWRWLVVEMTGAVGPQEFLGLLRRGAGLTPPEGTAWARIGLPQALGDDGRDGHPWLLVIENAQAASRAVWDEILALLHGMETGEGPASILLVGPTALARQLAGREWSAVASRLSAHVHLLPLDLDECRELLVDCALHEALGQSALERLHRDAAGNPRRILQLLSRRRHPLDPGTVLAERGSCRLAEPALPPRSADPQDSSPAASPSALLHGSQPSPGLLRAEDSTAACSQTSTPPVSAGLIPSPPPLRVEEGLVEVGWGGNLEAEAADALNDPESFPLAADSDPPRSEPYGEELVEDHYAALQAWNEWTSNRDSAGPLASEGSGPESADRDSGDPQEIDTESGRPGPRPLAGLRAEGQHEHAPYSQLFSRLRQSR